MNALSNHLFWDVNRHEIDPVKHAAWLTHRVLEYVRWADWRILVSEYGKPRLAELATELRTLSPKSLAFRSAWFQLPEYASDAPVPRRPRTCSRPVRANRLQRCSQCFLKLKLKDRVTSV